MDPDVMVALVFGVLGFLVSMVQLVTTHIDRNTAKENELKKEKSRRSEAFDATLAEFVNISKYIDHHDRPGYYLDFRTSCPADIELARRKLKSFWDHTINMYKDGDLPTDFFDRGQWLRDGDVYRKLVEPIDVANYHFRRIHLTESGPYENHRPERYKFLQSKWEEVAHEGDTVADSFRWCLELEQQQVA